MFKNAFPPKLHTIFLMGPTASGKTRLAIAMRRCLPVEIISVDSAMIYRDMDIGTAKPSTDELVEAPHRLINIRDPIEIYSVEDFRRDALKEMAEITRAGRIPLLVGGSLLYFKALLEGLSPLPPKNPEVRANIEYEMTMRGVQALHWKLKKIDPVSANRIHPNDLQRLSRALEVFLISGKTLTQLRKISGETMAYHAHKFIMTMPNRTMLHHRIEKRFFQMISDGFENEVRALLARRDLDHKTPSMRCVGYRQMWSYLAGKINYDDMVFRGICATRQLAKRQITWLKKWPNVHWLPGEQPDLALKKVLQVVSPEVG